MCTMNSLIFTLICCIVSASLSLVSSEDLGALCNNEPLELTRVSQVVSLIHQARSDPSGCKSEVVDALMDLEPILTENVGTICTTARAQQIVEFRKKHLAKSLSSRLLGSKIPKSLRAFVITLGFEVGQLCKDNMMRLLVADSRKQLTDQDFETFKSNGQNLFHAFSDRLHDSDNIVLIGEISEGLANQKLYVKTPYNQQIRKIKASCERRFKPFYEQLVLPFAVLANAGFVLGKESPESELVELESSRKLSTWHHITLICHLLSNIETFESESSSMARFIGLQEAQQLRSMQAERFDQDSGPQIIYEPENKQTLDDLNLDSKDARILESIGQFDNARRAMKSLRRQTLKRVAKAVRDTPLTKTDLASVFGFFKHRPSNSMELAEIVGSDIEDDESKIVRQKRSIRSWWKSLSSEDRRLLKRSTIYIVAIALVITAIGLCFG